MHSFVLIRTFITDFRRKVLQLHAIMDGLKCSLKLNSLCISGRLAVDFPESFSLAHTDPKLPLGGEASVIRTPSCRRTRSDQTEVFQHRFQFWHLASEEEKSRAMAESPSTGFIVACFPPFAAAADLSVCDHFHIMVMYDQCNQITFFSNTVKKHISKSVTLGN